MYTEKKTGIVLSEKQKREKLMKKERRNNTNNNNKKKKIGRREWRGGWTNNSRRRVWGSGGMSECIVDSQTRNITPSTTINRCSISLRWRCIWTRIHSVWWLICYIIRAWWIEEVVEGNWIWHSIRFYYNVVSVWRSACRRECISEVRLYEENCSIEAWEVDVVWRVCSIRRDVFESDCWYLECSGNSSECAVDERGRLLSAFTISDVCSDGRESNGRQSSNIDSCHTQEIAWCHRDCKICEW